MAEAARADATRQRLLDAAGAAFARHGYHATTTRDIAAAAGMSPAAVYVHHESKEDLLYLIALAGHQQTEQLVRGAIAGAATPEAQLAALVQAFALFQIEQHAVARVINYELGALTPAHTRQIGRLRRSIEAQTREVIQRGVDSGGFATEDVDLAATAVLSLCVDIARWYRKGGHSAARIVDFYAGTALRMVGAR
jgi:AcrR family transcriptional regulator